MKRVNGCKSCITTNQVPIHHELVHHNPCGRASPKYDVGLVRYPFSAARQPLSAARQLFSAARQPFSVGLPYACAPPPPSACAPPSAYACSLASSSHACAPSASLPHACAPPPHAPPHTPSSPQACAFYSPAHAYALPKRTKELSLMASNAWLMKIGLMTATGRGATC